MWHTAIHDMKTESALKEKQCRYVEIKAGPYWNKEDAERTIIEEMISGMV